MKKKVINNNLGDEMSLETVKMSENKVYGV